jgi:hypothetical protein
MVTGASATEVATITRVMMAEETTAGTIETIGTTGATETTEATETATTGTITGHAVKDVDWPTIAGEGRTRETIGRTKKRGPPREGQRRQELRSIRDRLSRSHSHNFC